MLLDDLSGSQQQCRRDGESQRFGCPCYRSRSRPSSYPFLCYVPLSSGVADSHETRNLHAAALRDDASQGITHALALSTARRQPSYRAARVASSHRGSNRLSSVQRRSTSSIERHTPAPSPARYAAPSAVVSITRGRNTATSSTSAWNWHRKSFAAAPPSTRSSRTAIPASAAIASSTSRLWNAIASSAARARCAPVVPRVRPTIVPRAYMSQ